jgi:hypothetical protein
MELIEEFTQLVAEFKEKIVSIHLVFREAPTLWGDYAESLQRRALSSIIYGNVSRAQGRPCVQYCRLFFRKLRAESGSDR